MSNNTDDIINKREFTQKLPHKLGDAELANIARKIGEKNREISKLVAEKAQKNDHYKALIDGANAEAASLAEQAATGIEERETLCIEQQCFRSGTVRIVRMDTGEITNERPFTNEERQGKFQDWLERQNEAARKERGVDPTNKEAPPNGEGDVIEGEVITDENRMLPPAPPPEGTEITDPQKLIDDEEPKPTGRKPRKRAGRRRGRR